MHQPYNEYIEFDMLIRRSQDNSENVTVMVVLSVDCMLSGGAGCSGEWGQPMDNNATLCLSGRQLSGELTITVTSLLICKCFVDCAAGLVSNFSTNPVTALLL